MSKLSNDAKAVAVNEEQIAAEDIRIVLDKPQHPNTYVLYPNNEKGED